MNTQDEWRKEATTVLEEALMTFKKHASNATIKAVQEGKEMTDLNIDPFVIDAFAVALSQAFQRGKDEGDRRIERIREAIATNPLYDESVNERYRNGEIKPGCDSCKDMAVRGLNRGVEDSLEAFDSATNEVGE